MLRRATLLALSAALLACPANVPKGLDPGAFVRLDVLGNPIVEVQQIQDGVLVCREIPSMRPRRIPVSQIHHVSPVSSAVVARIRSLAHRRPVGNIGRRLDQAGAAMSGRLQGLVPQNSANLKPPTLPPAPQQLGDPSMAPKSAEDVPFPTDNGP